MKLTEWRELMERATPGPWRHYPMACEGSPIYGGDVDSRIAEPPAYRDTDLKTWQHDAALIVALRNNAEKMLAVVEAAKALSDSLFPGGYGDEMAYSEDAADKLTRAMMALEDA